MTAAQRFPHRLTIVTGHYGTGKTEFSVNLALALAGGIVPGALLPAGVRRLSPLSPVTWLMRLAALPMGYDLPLSSLAGLLLAGSGMLGAALALYRRRANCQEVAL